MYVSQFPGMLAPLSERWLLFASASTFRGHSLCSWPTPLLSSQIWPRRSDLRMAPPKNRPKTALTALASQSWNMRLSGFPAPAWHSHRKQEIGRSTMKYSMKFMPNPRKYEKSTLYVFVYFNLNNFRMNSAWMLCYDMLCYFSVIYAQDSEP